MNQSESITALAKALIAVQKALPSVTKDKENPYFHSKYAGLDTVMPVVLETLTANGFSVAQMPDSVNGGTSALTTLLMHESGEWISATQPLLLAKEEPQGQGSAITYARRYSIMSLLGLVADEDDDGNAASPQRDPRPPAQQYAEDRAPQQRGPMTQAKHMPSSQYGGKCFECGYGYEAGDPIYFQKVDGKSRCWHEACYSPE